MGIPSSGSSKDLQECHRQQVRPAQAPSSTLCLSGGRASAGDSGEGIWGWIAASSGSGLPISSSEARWASPPTPGSRRRILGTPLLLLLAQVCALPAGSAGDCFPREPRGKRGSGACGGGEQGASGRGRQGERLRAATV